MRPLTFASGCSGIEAAKVAWTSLGWACAFVAEVDPAPAKVLMHRHDATRPLFPLRVEDASDQDDAMMRRAWAKEIARMPEGGSIPNYGDMSRYQEWGDADIDVFVAGTPCQDFSVAGLRAGLDGPRGALMLKYGGVAGRYRPRWLLWENVPGVLSIHEGRDFASFLGLLSGQGIEPPKSGWQNTGIIAPGSPHAYGLCWRVLDAQYFGVPQRRRRVFVIGHLGDWRPAAAVLLERHSLSGNPPPRRKARQDVAGTISARTQGGGGLGTDFDLDVGLQAVAFGGNNTSGEIEVATALNAHGGPHGFDASEDGTGRGTPLVPTYAIQAGALRENPDSGPDDVGVQADVAYTLEARSEVQMVAFDTTQITSQLNRANPQDGDPCHPLAATAHAPAIAFSSGNDAGEVAPTLRAMGHRGSHANAGGQLAIAHAFDARQSDVVQYGDRTGPLDTDGHSVAVAVNLRGREGGAMPELDDKASLRAANGGSSRSYVQTAAVRRLTPRECERLQGFEDDYTSVPVARAKNKTVLAAPREAPAGRVLTLGKPGNERPYQMIDGIAWQLAADGPRYKQLGNSMAVVVMRWLGQRIALVDAEL